jgi:hypothetical protein
MPGAEHSCPSQTNRPARQMLRRTGSAWKKGMLWKDQQRRGEKGSSAEVRASEDAMLIPC